MAVIKQIKCPLCGWYHPITRTGIMRLQRGEAAHQPKGDFLFLTDDPADLTFICIRECAGRGKGLPEVEKITLAEARREVKNPSKQQALSATSIFFKGKLRNFADNLTVLVKFILIIGRLPPYLEKSGTMVSISM